MERKNIVFLDTLRGFAAIYVMVGHARWLLWEGYSEGYQLHPETYSAYNKLLMYFFSLFKYGHEAVLLFFVLSGFVIHLRYAKNFQRFGEFRFEFFSYLSRRFWRIVPPLLLAIFITFLLDSIGGYQGYKIYFNQTNYTVMNENIFSHHDWGTLLGNVFS